jgi:MFS family permease
MFLTILRSLGSVLAGLLAALALIAATEVFSTIFHPWPAGADKSDFEVCRAQVASYPTWVLAACTLGWFAAVFCGAWLATRLGTRRHIAHGWAVALLLLALAGINIAMLPYAIWFPIAVVIGFPLAAFAATRLASPSNPPPPSGLSAKPVAT